MSELEILGSGHTGTVMAVKWEAKAAAVKIFAPIHLDAAQQEVILMK